MTKLTNRKKRREKWNHHAYPEGHKGQDHQCAKLTECQVYEIRIEHKNGSEIEDLAKKYNIGQRTVVEILTGRAWKHLGLKDIYRRKPKPPKVIHKAKCVQCEKEFTAKTANRRFCSNKCCTENQKGKQVEER